MDFISTGEAAERWNISQRRVIRLAGEGRISGARLFGKSWMIPADAVKPADGRTKNAAKQKNALSFRFPLYVNRDEDCFSPPLSPAEICLRNAQLAFLSCRMEEAKSGFEALKEHDNPCIRITALFFLCYLSAVFYNGAEFKDDYIIFSKALSADFPHRQEMLLLKSYLLASIVLYESAAESHHIDMDYDYSPTAYPLMTVLSAFTKTNVRTPEAVRALLDINEILSRQLEKDGHIYEAQMMHIMLFWAYQADSNEKAKLYHLKKSLDIAFCHDFLYPVADTFTYYADIFNDVLKDYPEEFANRIRCFGAQIHRSFSVFMSKHQITDMYTQLSKTEFQYMEYAVWGYTNKEVAGILHLSVRTVANRYAEIYDKLDIKSKQELIDKYKSWSCQKDTERRLEK